MSQRRLYSTRTIFSNLEPDALSVFEWVSGEQCKGRCDKASAIYLGYAELRYGRLELLTKHYGI